MESRSLCDSVLSGHLLLYGLQKGILLNDADGKGRKQAL